MNEIERLKKEMIPILKKNGVIKAGIFGSYARGEQKKNSDIDVLVEFNEIKGLFELVHLQLALEDKIKKKFDVLTYNSVHPYIKEYVMKDEVRII
jgi:predicted nucleotidyltransferase